MRLLDYAVYVSYKCNHTRALKQRPTLSLVLSLEHNHTPACRHTHNARVVLFCLLFLSLSLALSCFSPLSLAESLAERGTERETESERERVTQAYIHTHTSLCTHTYAHTHFSLSFACSLADTRAFSLTLYIVHTFSSFRKPPLSVCHTETRRGW